MAQSMNVRVGVVFLFAALLTITTRPHAEPTSPLTLQWDAPAECPSADDIQIGVKRLLESPEPAPPNTPVSANVTIKRAGKMWRVLLVTETRGTSKDVRGRRSFVGETCRSVADV